MTTIATSVPARGHWLAAGVVAASICVPGLAMIPFGEIQLPANPAFLPSFGSVTLLVDLITTVLLFSQAQAAQDRSTAQLGAAYLFSVLTVVPHLLAFPGVFAPTSLIGGSASAVWLWCVWHGGFALCVLRYALGAGRARPGRTELRRVRIWPIVTVTAVVVAVLSLIATVGLPLLPTVLIGGSYARMNSLGIGPAVVLCNVAALAAVLARVRRGSVLQVWLAVAMTASTFDTMLTMFGGGRFTLGWYLARCFSVTTGVVVLVALLSELTSLFTRTTARNRQLEILSMTDGLTNIANRRAFDEALASEWRRALRGETALSLLMIDIDHFKLFNDLYGHPAGDACLRQVAGVLQQETRRAADLASRIGGEEFAILLPNTEERGAEQVAAAVHQAIARLQIEAETSGEFVTVSVGLATTWVTAEAGKPSMLVLAADAALYMAKQAGRNRTCIAGGGAAERLAELVLPG